MSEEYVIAKKSEITAVADAVRSKTGKSEQIPLSKIGEDIGKIVNGEKLLTGELSAFESNMTKLRAYAFYYAGEGAENSLRKVVLPYATEIGESAFYGCNRINSFKIPRVTVIGANSFYNCDLTNAEIPFESISSIGEGSFWMCRWPKSEISFSCLTKIPDYAFRNGFLLSVVNLPNVTEIGKKAFNLCDKLIKINAPQLTTIRDSAFYYSPNLNFTDFNNVKAVYSNAFNRNSVITEIKAPSLNSLSSSAFGDMNALKYVNFPSAQSIPKNCFHNCINLLKADFGSATSMYLGTLLKIVFITVVH